MAKVFENRVRRMAGRQGLTLRRNPRRDPRAIGYGEYTLLDGEQIVNGVGGTTLEAIEAYLLRGHMLVQWELQEIAAIKERLIAAE